MILDAVLFTLRRIVKNAPGGFSLALLPEMKITPPEGVLVKSPVSEYALSLTGSVDYGVIKYKEGRWADCKCLVIF
jgi:hypothetical protein